jgi:hypothetical protein
MSNDIKQRNNSLHGLALEKSIGIKMHGKEAYPFTTIQKLIEDFITDVREQRKQYYASQD